MHLVDYLIFIAMFASIAAMIICEVAAAGGFNNERY